MPRAEVARRERVGPSQYDPPTRMAALANMRERLAARSRRWSRKVNPSGLLASSPSTVGLGSELFGDDGATELRPAELDLSASSASSWSSRLQDQLEGLCARRKSIATDVAAKKQMAGAVSSGEASEIEGRVAAEHIFENLAARVRADMGMKSAYRHLLGFVLYIALVLGVVSAQLTRAGHERIHTTVKSQLFGLADAPARAELAVAEGLDDAASWWRFVERNVVDVVFAERACGGDEGDGADGADGAAACGGDASAAARRRYFSPPNLVLVGPLFTQERVARAACDPSEFAFLAADFGLARAAACRAIDASTGAPDAFTFEPFGSDPTFAPSSRLYDAANAPLDAYAAAELRSSGAPFGFFFDQGSGATVPRAFGYPVVLDVNLTWTSPKSKRAPR